MPTSLDDLARLTELVYGPAIHEQLLGRPMTSEDRARYIAGVRERWRLEDEIGPLHGPWRREVLPVGARALGRVWVVPYLRGRRNPAREHECSC